MQILDDIKISKNKEIIKSELPYLSPEYKDNLFNTLPFTDYYQKSNIFALGLIML